MLGSRKVDPVLIVDGQNNHDWVSTTDSIEATLRATGRFSVEIDTAPQTKSMKGIRGPKADAPDYLKESYKNFRRIQQGAEKEDKESQEEEWKNWNPFTGRHQAVVLNYNGGNGLKRPRNLQSSSFAREADWFWSMPQIMLFETGMLTMK